eukprot:154952_1
MDKDSHTNNSTNDKGSNAAATSNINIDANNNNNTTTNVIPKAQPMEPEPMPPFPPQPSLQPSISIESITNPNDDRLKKLVDAPEFIPTPQNNGNNRTNCNAEQMDKDRTLNGNDAQINDNEGHEGISGDLDENGEQSESQKTTELRVDAPVFQPNPNQMMSHPKFVTARQPFQNPFGSTLATISETGADDTASPEQHNAKSSPLPSTNKEITKLPNIRDKIIKKESAMSNIHMNSNNVSIVNGTKFKFTNGTANGHFASESYLMKNGYDVHELNDNIQNADRHPLSGQQLSVEHAICYSVASLWEYRQHVTATDFEDLLVEDENFEETNKISIHEAHQRLEINRILTELSLMKEGTHVEEDATAEDPSFVRGINVRSNRKKRKLSDKYAKTGGFQLKMAHDLDENERLTKRIMGVLNLITPEKFDKLATKMMSIISELADNEEKFTTILDSILNKASTEPVFAEQYANLCFYLSQQLPSLMDKFQWILGEERDRDTKSKSKNKKNAEDNISKQISKVFRKMMIMSCERRFSSQRQQVLERLPSDIDEESKQDLEQRRKKKFFGTMIIVGQLFNKKLVHSNIINKGIIKSLLPPENKKLSPIEIEALCKLLKTCGKAMDKDDKSHKILSRYIQAMKTHSAKFEFRIQVIVDEIEEMKNNNWELRIKKEKAKTLDEIHKDFAKQQTKPYYKKKAHHKSHHHHRYDHHHHPQPKPEQQKKQIKAKVISLTKECLSSGNCQCLMEYLRQNNHHLICNEFWGEITNTIFINRSSTEIDKFIEYLTELFAAQCIHNTHDEFVEYNVSFLAINCDDSAQDCPLFTKYLGTLFAQLFENDYVPITCLEYFHAKYSNDKENDEYSVDAKTKIRRFSKIVLSILNCLTQSKSENVLQQISKQTSFMNSDNIDRNVFYDNMALFDEYVSQQ